MSTHVLESVDTCDQKVQTQKVSTHIPENDGTCDQKIQTHKTQKTKSVNT